jgi:catechol 2,3-dioxygenase-like lactoylglutathione lyase family enzyme
VLIVVDDLEAVKAFFVALGMELEGETTVEGLSVDRLIGLHNVRATIALLRTPDGHGRIELDKFHTPEAMTAGPENAPVNALGIRRIMFAVNELDAVVTRLHAQGAELVGDVEDRRQRRLSARHGAADGRIRRFAYGRAAQADPGYLRCGF